MNMKPKLVLTTSIMVTLIVAVVSSTSITSIYAVEAGQPDKLLTAKWWEWVMAIPPADNPLDDDTGANCGVDQKGPIWYLAGTTGGFAERECTIPEGKRILFPIINTFCSELTDADLIKLLLEIPENEPIPPSQLKSGLISCAEFFMDQVDILEVSIDGQDVTNLEESRVQSPLFKIVYPEDNVFGVTANTGIPQKSIADGFWVLLDGLEAGEHTIEFKGGISSFPFETGVLYHITIE